MDYKDMEEDGFWFEVQEISQAFLEICHRYDMSDRVLSAFVVGLLEEIDEDKSNLKAFFHYNIQNEHELDIITGFMGDSYSPPQDEEPDINDLLDGLGISLN
tara:strand:+ start:865 stop:1170 length:306 start_codon:yes stop_codon:yes gene_type:complete